MRSTSGRVVAMNIARSAAAHPACDALEQPEVRKLTKEYLTIRRTSESDGVDAVLQMGRILADGKPKVKGRWEDWLHELETARTTGRRYLRFAAFAAEHPAEFAALKALGASKVHRVVQLSPRGVHHLMSRDLAELRRLSFRAFAKLTRKFLRRAVAGGLRAGSLARRVRGLTEQLVGVRLRSLDGPWRRRLAHDLALLERRARTLRRRF